MRPDERGPTISRVARVATSAKASVDGRHAADPAPPVHRGSVAGAADERAIETSARRAETSMVRSAWAREAFCLSPLFAYAANYSPRCFRRSRPLLTGVRWGGARRESKLLRNKTLYVADSTSAKQLPIGRSVDRHPGSKVPVGCSQTTYRDFRAVVCARHVQHWHPNQVAAPELMVTTITGLAFLGLDSFFLQNNCPSCCSRWWAAVLADRRPADAPQLASTCR